MDITNKLIFYNKDGYPYNFQYDNINNKWVGKILFEENSINIYKDIIINIFEKVPPIEFTDNVDLVSLQVFNNSGITFTNNTQDEPFEITEIKNVNHDSDFYSKWVYGENIDRMFPRGTIITFSGLTGTGSYEDEFPIGDTYYYSVVDNKNNAILITTPLSNDNYLSDPYTVNGGYIISHNVITIPDYNQNLLSWFNDLNLYEYDEVEDNYKKLSIHGTQYNDGVYNYMRSGYTSGFIKDFMVSGFTGSTINLVVTLYTERPRIYNGSITITQGTPNDTGYIKFNDGINSLITTGITIFFEDMEGNLIAEEQQYTIDSIEDKIFVSQLELSFIKNTFEASDKLNNYIEINGNILSDYKKGDTIFLSGITAVNNIFNDNRYFNIKDIFYQSRNNKTTIYTHEYVIQEHGNTYDIYKVINNVDTVRVSSTGTIVTTGYTESLCFLNTNVLNYPQEIVYTGITDGNYTYEELTINSFKEKYDNTLDIYGINTYYLDGYFIVESKWDFYSRYFDCNFYIDDTEITPEYNYSVLGLTNKYHMILYDELVYEKYHLNDTEYLSRNYVAEIILQLEQDIVNYGFRIDLNGVQYYIDYNTISGNTTCQYETMIDFINKYYHIFYVNGFIISTDDYSISDTGVTLYVEGLYPNVVVTDLNVNVNMFSRYTINERNRKCIVISGNEIKNPQIENFYDNELSTGMILFISGSTYYSNNREYNIIGLTSNNIQLSYQSHFQDDLSVDISFSTKETIRKPRGSYNKDIYYRFIWGNDINESIFMYDFSGNQLQYTNSIPYIGPTPLTSSNSNVYLNPLPNRLLENNDKPEHQQTVFDTIIHKLESLNSSKNYNYVPEPIQLFVGYSSSIENVDSRTLKMEKYEYLSFTGYTSNYSGTTGLEYNNFIITGSTIFYDTYDIFFNFFDMGFETGHVISTKFVDVTATGQTIYMNPYNYTIIDMSNNTLTLDISEQDLLPFDTSNSIYYFKINVEPKEVMNLTFYGETENEDERLNINLINIGANLKPDDYHIFKESDINEKGIDYKILNKKRKELLINYTEIYNYIGSYKSLINSIKFFGYNDLQVYEYYRNVDRNSPLFRKLYKILIPDIFDNTIEGWNEQDWLKFKYNNDTYKKTNLFNLTYKMTDFNGNYVEYYSIDEVQVKLSGLVRWLRNNILPLSTNIYDITGVANTITDLYQIYDSSNWVTKFDVEQEVTAINFNYIQTLNHNDNYFITVKFYIPSGNTVITPIEPSYFDVKIRTFKLDPTTKMLIPVQYIELYKTDLEPYTFQANRVNDPYIYVETNVYNDYGLPYKNNKVFNFNEKKNYILINNNFNNNNYKYLYTNNLYYIIIKDGNFYVTD